MNNDKSECYVGVDVGKKAGDCTAVAHMRKNLETGVIEVQGIDMLKMVSADEIESIQLAILALDKFRGALQSQVARLEEWSDSMSNFAATTLVVGGMMEERMSKIEMRLAKLDAPMRLGCHDVDQYYSGDEEAEHYRAED